MCYKCMSAVLLLAAWPMFQGLRACQSHNWVIYTLSIPPSRVLTPRLDCQG